MTNLPGEPDTPEGANEASITALDLPTSKRLPWIGISAMAIALLAVITYTTFPMIVQAATPAPATPVPVTAPSSQPASPSPAKPTSDLTQDEKPQSDQGTDPESNPDTDLESEKDKPSWRERSADLLKRAAKRLEDSEQADTEKEPSAGQPVSKTEDADTPDSEKPRIKFFAKDGSFQFTVGSAPNSGTGRDGHRRLRRGAHRLDSHGPSRHHHHRNDFVCPHRGLMADAPLKPCLGGLKQAGCWPRLFRDNAGLPALLSPATPEPPTSA